MTFYLHRNEAIDPGLRRIAREQIDIGLRDFADESVSELRKVHSLRIRCKKVRGVLKLVRPVMGDAYEFEDERYRAAAKELAGNRDEVVCASLVVSLSGPNDYSKLSPRPLSVEAQKRSLEILESGRAAIESWPVALHGFYDIAPGFARTYRKCLQAWHEIRQQPSDEMFHQLRRWAKYHWYHTRILERLNKADLRPRRIVMHRLQKVLGDAHDFVLLDAYLTRHGVPDKRVRREVVARKEALYAEAIKLGQTVFQLPVSRLVANCSGYWADRDAEDRVR